MNNIKRTFIAIATLATLLISGCGQHDTTANIFDVKIKKQDQEKLLIEKNLLEGTLDVDVVENTKLLEYKDVSKIWSKIFKKEELERLFKIKHLKDFKDGKSFFTMTRKIMITEPYEVDLGKIESDKTLFNLLPLHRIAQNGERRTLEILNFPYKISTLLALDLTEMSKDEDNDDDIGGLIPELSSSLLEDNTIQMIQDKMIQVFFNNEAQELSEQQDKKKADEKKAEKKVENKNYKQLRVTLMKFDKKTSIAKVFGSNEAYTPLELENTFRFLDRQNIEKIMKKDGFVKSKRDPTGRSYVKTAKLADTPFQSITIKEAPVK